MKAIVTHIIVVNLLTGVFMMTITRERILLVLPILLACMSWLGFTLLADILFDIGGSSVVAWVLISIGLLSYGFFSWIYVNKVQQLINENTAESNESIKVNNLRNVLILLGFVYVFASIFIIFRA